MRIHVDKRKWHWWLLNGVLVLLLLICGILFHQIAGTLDSIHAAERWRGENEMRFSQIACFLPVDTPKSEEDILQFRRDLDQKLVDASVESANGTALYSDAYSGSSKLTVSGDHGTAEVKVIGVGGNFFLFHPLRLRSGSYISETDLMQDRVVLDETLAWQLFGGSDVAGMTVTIANKPYYVAGVIARENDFASREAYLDGAGLFLSYSAFHDLTEAEITCYEIVMPDMISGFAKTIVSETLDIGFGDIVENTGRYSLKNILQVIGDYGHRSMRNNGVIYPYWENAVRLTEDYLALLMVLMLLLGVCPVATVTVTVVKSAIRLFHYTGKRLPERADAARERKREERYAKSEGK